MDRGHDTTMLDLPGTAVTVLGGGGAVVVDSGAGDPATSEVAEAKPLSAFTVKVWVPLGSDLTTQDVAPVDVHVDG